MRLEKTDILGVLQDCLFREHIGSVVTWAGSISTKNLPFKTSWKVLLKSNFVNLSYYLMHSSTFFSPNESTKRLFVISVIVPVGNNRW